MKLREQPTITLHIDVDDEIWFKDIENCFAHTNKQLFGDSSYVYTVSRYQFQRTYTMHIGKWPDIIMDVLAEAFVYPEYDYVAFHWYDPKPDAKRKKNFEKRFKKSLI